jgi:hypothetical protein
MRFAVDPDVELFGASVRGALAGWEPPLEPVFGHWQDDRDDGLAERLAAVGWTRLVEEPELLAWVAAGALELGRAVAPLCLLDEATLGGPLWVEGRVRHGEGRSPVATLGAGGEVWLREAAEGEREPTLDGTGTVRGVALGGPASEARSSRAWAAGTLGYLAGLAQRALDGALAHVRTREQFGAPLASLPSVQQRLADAALAVDGLELSAWRAASPAAGEPPLPAPSLLWAGAACREVTAISQQAHGAFGFALESGLHRAYRRAKTVQVWSAAACRAASGDR